MGNADAEKDAEKFLDVIDVTKVYRMGEVTVNALRGVSLSLYQGEFAVILGPSGSGKSTLLNIIGGIDKPSSGQIVYKDRDISRIRERELTDYRCKAVGFVFQFYNLIPNLTARENIMLAAELSANPIPADKLLSEIGLADRADHFPSKLSGGQQQRVAVARALCKNPSLLLCDEPTGALDIETGVSILRLLQDFNINYRKTVAIITHNAGIGAMADRVIRIRDGVIDSITQNGHKVSADEVIW